MLFKILPGYIPELCPLFVYLRFSLRLFRSKNNIRPRDMAVRGAQSHVPEESPVFTASLLVFGVVLLPEVSFLPVCDFWILNSFLSESAASWFLSAYTCTETL